MGLFLEHCASLAADTGRRGVPVWRKEWHDDLRGTKTGGYAGNGTCGSSEPVLPIRTNRLYRSRTEKKVFGVCGGIANYIGTDPTIVRLLFVIAGFASLGFMILLYIAMAIVVP